MGSKLLAKGSPRKKIKHGQKLIDIMNADKSAMENQESVKPLDAGSLDIENVGTPWGPISLRQNAWISAYLNPDEAAGDIGLASKYVGVSRKIGEAWLQLPQIRARIAHAMGEAGVTPEAIVAVLVNIAFSDERDDSARVRAAELLMKNKGMLVERSINIDVSNPNAVADLILAELQRVTPQIFEAEVINPDTLPPIKLPELLPAESGEKPKKPEYLECLRLVSKVTKAKKTMHGALRLSPDGAYCESCKVTESPIVLESYRSDLQGQGYRYRDGVWYRPLKFGR